MILATSLISNGNGKVGKILMSQVPPGEQIFNEGQSICCCTVYLSMVVSFLFSHLPLTSEFKILVCLLGVRGGQLDTRAMDTPCLHRVVFPHFDSRTEMDTLESPTDAEKIAI